MSLDGTALPKDFGSVRKMVAAFGTIFNNITVPRVDMQGNIMRYDLVPLVFGPKEQWFSKSTTKHSTSSDNRPIEFSGRYPAISYKFTTLTYDSSRQVDPRHVYRKKTELGVNYKQLIPAPYNLGVEMIIMAKNIADGLAVVEQVLPLFQPHMNLRINEIPELDIVYDMMVLLESTNYTDNYEQGFDENRESTWTLQFALKGQIYPPMVARPITERAIVDVFAVDTTVKNAAGHVLDIPSVSPESLEGRDPDIRYEIPEEQP